MTDKQQKALKRKLSAEADRLWHRACLKKWGNKCFFFDSEKKAHGHKYITDTCHHFKQKGYYGNLRYNLDNGVPVCWNCHTKLEQIDFTMQQDIIKKRGQEWNDNLNKLFEEGRKGSFQTISYYAENIIRMKKYLNNSGA